MQKSKSQPKEQWKTVADFTKINKNGVDAREILKELHKLKLGIYTHYKGKKYEVIGLAKHSETFEEVVVYRALYGKNDLWVRPLKMFLGKVKIDGKKAPRFKYKGK